MFPFIKNGKVYVPITPTLKAGETIGDATREMLPVGPDHEKMVEWIKQHGEAR